MVVLPRWDRVTAFLSSHQNRIHSGNKKSHSEKSDRTLKRNRFPVKFSPHSRADERENRADLQKAPILVISMK